MHTRLSSLILCLLGVAVGLAACSTPSTGDANSYASADDDAMTLVFDTKGFHSDASKPDANKTDATPTDVKVDAKQSDAGKADIDASKVDVDAAIADGTESDTAGDDAAALDATDDAAAQDADLDAAIADAADDADALDDSVDDATPGSDAGGTPSPFAHLCDPCTATAACNGDGGDANQCVGTGADGAFCGVACDPSATAACPDFYSCDAVPGGGHQCRPVSGVCTCSLTAAIAKLSTTCSVTNATGTCLGTRSCGASGLGKCTALPAMDEVCNGVDDNCDGKTDEGLCSGNVCLAGTCDAVTNVCTPAPVGTACDDANNCTTADACSFGTCIGTSSSDGNDTAPGSAIANKSDCDNTSKMQSILAPGSDVDWYTFKASDDTFCSIYPSARVDQMAGDYDLCVYWACKDGTSDSGSVDCNSGTKVSGGPNGMWGCCSANAGVGSEKVEINSTCSTLGLGNDGGTATIQVKAHSPKTANICGGYTLSWSAASF